MLAHICGFIHLCLHGQCQCFQAVISYHIVYKVKKFGQTFGLKVGRGQLICGL